MEQNRNDKCACGSGKKYKRCCIKKILRINSSVKKRRLTKDERIALQLKSFGKQSVNPKRNAIKRVSSVPKGQQREANVRAASKKIEE